MAFKKLRFKYNISNFYFSSLRALEYVGKENMSMAEIYSRRAVKYGRRARDLSSKIGVSLDENFTNMLSCAEEAYEFAKKHNKKS
ncbi:MAG: hypothetical protein Q8N63_05835 [Nanoarchaeota archaeon]|nr:hypothetical protein [Nanoarchaeota archaeon]